MSATDVELQSQKEMEMIVAAEAGTEETAGTAADSEAAEEEASGVETAEDTKWAEGETTERRDEAGRTEDIPDRSLLWGGVEGERGEVCVHNPFCCMSIYCLK